MLVCSISLLFCFVCISVVTDLCCLKKTSRCRWEWRRRRWFWLRQRVNVILKICCLKRSQITSVNCFNFKFSPFIGYFLKFNCLHKSNVVFSFTEQDDVMLSDIKHEDFVETHRFMKQQEHKWLPSNVEILDFPPHGFCVGLISGVSCAIVAIIFLVIILHFYYCWLARVSCVSAILHVKGCEHDVL